MGGVRNRGKWGCRTASGVVQRHVHLPNTGIGAAMHHRRRCECQGPRGWGGGREEGPGHSIPLAHSLRGVLGAGGEGPRAGRGGKGSTTRDLIAQGRGLAPPSR